MVAGTMAIAMRYPIPAITVRVEDEIKGSRFITTVAAAATERAAHEFVDSIRREFSEASHNCWSYLVGAPGPGAATGASDDGEPGGTAGRPMLTVLLNSGIGDIAVVVTRFFGGTKLGRGGLVRAYGGAVQHALRELPLGEFVATREVQIRAPYNMVATIQRLLREYSAEVLEDKYEADVVFRIAIAEDRLMEFELAAVDATNATVVIEAL